MLTQKISKIDFKNLRTYVLIAPYHTQSEQGCDYNSIYIFLYSDNVCFKCCCTPTSLYVQVFLCAYTCVCNRKRREQETHAEKTLLLSSSKIAVQKRRREKQDQETVETENTN